MFIFKGCKGFEDYKLLVDKHKLNRQDARGKLPIDTATIALIHVILFLNGAILLIYVIMVRLALLIQMQRLLLGMYVKELIKFGYDF